MAFPANRPAPSILQYYVQTNEPATNKVTKNGELPVLEKEKKKQPCVQLRRVTDICPGAHLPRIIPCGLTEAVEAQHAACGYASPGLLPWQVVCFNPRLGHEFVYD
jgi:hypothetical protein